METYARKKKGEAEASPEVMPDREETQALGGGLQRVS